MKTSFYALILLLFFQAATVMGQKAEPAASNRAALEASFFWPQDSTVKVYFVRGLFTSEQKQMLWQTLESWAQRAAATATIRFSYAGETDGLIDCLACLTVTRQEVYTNDSRRQASFNRLRGGRAGQLISAWIGLNRSLTDLQKLRVLLVRTLDAERLLAASVHETSGHH